MPRLIRVFAGRTGILLVLSCRGSCYVLLKMTKNDIIGHFIEEESVTSYHLKMCLFYTIEETPGQLLKEKHLLLCLQKCLGKLLRWTEKQKCPNYFFPDENMFDRVSRDLLIRLKEVLKQLLPSNFNYLVPICCDNVGKLLGESCTSPGFYRQSVKHTHLLGKQATLQTCRELYKSSSTVSSLLGYCYRRDLTEVIDLLLDTSKELMKLMPLSANTKKSNTTGVTIH